MTASLITEIRGPDLIPNSAWSTEHHGVTTPSTTLGVAQKAKSEKEHIVAVFKVSLF